MKTFNLTLMVLAMLCLIKTGLAQNTNVMIKTDGIKVDDSTTTGHTAYLKSGILDFQCTGSFDEGIYSKDSLYLYTDNSGLPLYSLVKPGLLEMTSVLTDTKIDSYRAIFRQNQLPVQTEIIPGYLHIDSADCNAIIDFVGASFSGTTPFLKNATLTKDSLHFFTKPSIPLFESYSTLAADRLQFLYASDESYLDPRTFYMTNGNNQAFYSPWGIENLEILSPSDIFTRFSLKPDSLTMFNGAKWQTVYLGTHPQNLGGKLDLYHTTGEKHTSIFENGQGDTFLEMYYRDSLRIFAGNFSEYGIINTFGENGNINTYLGKANTHGDADFGGMGVMDDIGFVRAGMDVDQSKQGVVYAQGRFEIVDHNHHPWSISDDHGYQLRDQSGNFVISLNRDILDPAIGYLNTYGSNHTGNFFGGANFLYDGNGNGGLTEVLDANGVAQAGLFSNVNDEGVVFSDYVYIGCLDTFSIEYPLSVDQTPDHGIRIRKEKDDQYEFFIDGNGDLIILYNGLKIGSFDKFSGTYSPISDISRKEEIQPLESVIDRLLQLRPSRYIYSFHNPERNTSVGFIAQEVQQVFPELVKVPSDKNAPMTVDYTGLSVMAIKALQEQQEITLAQQQEINNLKERIARIEAFINK